MIATSLRKVTNDVPPKVSLAVLKEYDTAVYYEKKSIFKWLN